MNKIISKREIKACSDFCKRLPRVLAKKAFLVFLASLLLCLAVGGAVFYKYSVSAKSAAEMQAKLEFKENTYQNVLSAWQDRENRLTGASDKTYPDPF